MGIVRSNARINQPRRLASLPYLERLAIEPSSEPSSAKLAAKYALTEWALHFSRIHRLIRWTPVTTAPGIISMTVRRASDDDSARTVDVTAAAKIAPPFFDAA